MPPQPTSAKKTAGKSAKKSAKKSVARKPAVAKKKASTAAPRKKRGREERITIKTVAEAAGVSIATVSFVLNKRPGQVISEPVRKKVLAAARELNYAPSAAAATLARKQTTNVAIVFYQNDHLITNQFYSFVVQGTIKEAAANEYNIMFSFMHDEFKDYSDLSKVIREKNAEGVLFVQQVSTLLIEELLPGTPG
jgi:LacI family transcriptional regulator